MSWTSSARTNSNFGVEAAFKEQIAQRASEGVWLEKQTEQIILAAARVGQHAFAVNAPSNRGQRCVFRGLKPMAFGAKLMLVAGHIKPWKDSAPSERLDLRNGLAACPDHDVAFDRGRLTVGAGLQIHFSEALANAVRGDPLTRQYYGRPPLLSGCSSPMTHSSLPASISTGIRPKCSSPDQRARRGAGR